MTSLNPVRTIGSQIAEVIVKHQKLNKVEAKAKAIDLMKRVGITDAQNDLEIIRINIQGECANGLSLPLLWLVDLKY